jgi:hypothetical protein
MEQLEPVETKICRACGVEKTIKRFPILLSGNRAGVCGICKATGKNIPKTSYRQKPHPKNKALTLGFLRKEDYKDTYKLLQSMGYNLSQDLHEQFCKKYGLIPNSPKQTFINHYSQEDCGLV